MWKAGMEDKIRDILSVPVRKDEHHFGRPFLTAYQIAIEFKRRYPNEFEEFGLPLGGRDTNERTSFTQQLARELSQRILTEELKGMDGRDLYLRGIETLSFPCEGGMIDCSKDTHLSMFRLTDKDPK